jgi:hypothetical protein
VNLEGDPRLQTALDLVGALSGMVAQRESAPDVPRGMVDIQELLEIPAASPPW